MKPSNASKSDDLRLGAVIGHPVCHSLSPAIFRFLNTQLVGTIHYQALDLAEDELAGGLELLKRLPFVGCNVTIPHKEEVIPLLDRLSPEARSIGAVNVVGFSNGRTIGYNTDHFGIRKTLEEHRVRVRGRVAVVLGAGGGAKAAIYALAKMGAKRIFIVNRTLSRADALARRSRKLHEKTQFLASAAIPSEAAAVYVNATPVQVARHGAGAFVLDMVYYARRDSRANSENYGLDMLIWQAMATWEIWMGKIPEMEKMKSRVKKHLLRESRRKR